MSDDAVVVSMPSPTARRLAVEWPYDALYMQRLLDVCGNDNSALGHLRAGRDIGMDPLALATALHELRRAINGAAAPLRVLSAYRR